MKNNRLIALLVAALMMLSCMMSGVMAEGEAVITAGRHSISLEKAQEAANDLFAEYEVTMASYGYTLTAEDYAFLRDEAVNTLVLYCVLDNVAEDMGLNEITEEEKAEVLTKAQSTYDELRSYLVEFYVTNYGLSEEEAGKTADQGLVEMGYSVELISEELFELFIYNKVFDAVTKDISMDEEAVRAYYQENYVAADEEAYANDIYSYEMAANYYGTPSYYIPAGYRNVSHILLTTPDEIAEEMEACNVKIIALEDEADAFVAELGELEVQPQEGEEAAEKRSVEAIQADIDAVNAEIEQLKAEYEAIIAKTLTVLADKIDEIYARIEAGEDFAALVAEYGEDPGMEASPEGYQVHAESMIYVPEFTEGAMAIEAVGGVSEPVLTEYGVHIIKYLSDVPAGAVELTAEMLAQFTEEALAAAQNDAFEAKVAEWSEQYPATINADLIVLPTDAAAEATEVE